MIPPADANPQRLVALLAFALLLLAACGGGQSQMPASLDARSKLAFGACAVPIADTSAVCGVLTVPEDRADKNSRLIGLPFTILPATSRSAAQPPNVIFTGGPGPSSLRVLEALSADDLKQYPLRQSRDIILMTQRGADLTTPQSLDCPELELDFAGGQRFANEAQMLGAAQACRDRLVAAGAKLQTYTTDTIARDMEDLRLLLGARRGFKQWNVIGSSYGSRLAQAYVRDFPGAARSVVYDGPSPLQERDLYYAGALDGLGNVIAACESQAACAQAYPQLQTRFAAALLALQEAPRSVRGIPVGGVDVVNALRAVLATPQPQYETLPLFMDLVARGDLAGADALLPFVNNLILAINPSGMFYTVTCTDDAGLTTPASNDLPPTGQGWPDALRVLMAREGRGLQARACPIWTKGQTLSTAGQRPLRSDLPSLITVGQFDASTPTTSADLLLTTLSRARKLVFTGRGHGLLESEACMLSIAAAFVDDPAKPLDSSCIEPAASLKFTTP
jgi:pimeloyl-ACP methyl ester carboxylesterase